MGKQSALKHKRKFFKNLISKGSKTAFGKDHDFCEHSQLRRLQRSAIKVQDYEGLRSLCRSNVVAGRVRHVLWPGKPLYLCEDLRNYFGSKIHSNYQRFDANTHKGGQKCVIVLYRRKKGCKLCQWENDLSYKEALF